MTKMIAKAADANSWFNSVVTCIRFTRDLYQTADQIDRLSDQELLDIGLHRGSLI